MDICAIAVENIYEWSCWHFVLITGIMSDVEMSAGTEQKSSAPVFRLVVFQNIPETYLFDQPINCNFTVDSSYSPSAQDRVGLYKVGWRSLSDHVSFENVELPLNENSGKVTFNGKSH